MNANIVLLPGDGIGPEVVRAAHQILETIARKFGHDFKFSSHLVGGSAIDVTGDALPDATLKACKSADAILFGAIGGPRWDNPSAKVRLERGLLGIRKELGLFANLRPVKLFRGLESVSPLRPERLQNVDLIFVRELTGGIYFGQPKGRETRKGKRVGFDTLIYDEDEIRRILQVAFELARERRKKVTSIDKANVLATMQVWREVAQEIAAQNKDIQFENQLVDSAAMRLITHASSFDVIVADNMFGDILSDEGGALTGTLGLLPSASLGEGTLGLYEPIHGSAPDIAGMNIANPIGTILSAALLLRHSLKLEKEAQAIEHAVQRVLDEGARTADLGESENPMSTEGMADVITAAIEASK